MFFLRFYGVLFFPQVRIKLLSRVQKMHFAAAHSDIAHETAFFPAPNRAAHKNCFALLTYQIRQCKHHQNNQNNCHFFLLDQTCCYVDIIVMAFAGKPPLKALWIICSNFYLSLRTISLQHSEVALLIGYIIPLSVKKKQHMTFSVIFFCSLQILTSFIMCLHVLLYF